MIKEIWKPIKGYEKIYEISNLGNVKSLAAKGSGKFKVDTVMKPFNNGRGYMYYSLNNGIKVKNFSGHRLVVEAFIEPNSDLPDINHKDGNKKNNVLANLERCNKKMNMVHASLTGLLKCGEESHLSKITESDIVKIKKLWGYNIEREIIAHVFNISYAQISRIVNNKNWKHLYKRNNEW